MNRLVIKFGGTSVMDPARIAHVAEIVKGIISRQPQLELLVVVSAMGHTTDHLLELANAVSRCPDKRELDLLMTTGEQVASTLVTMAIQALGVNAKSFTGAGAGIVTEKTFGSAKIKGINTKNLENCLSCGVIPVIAGFQGVTEDGEITTLGRGGSDTTAIAIAAVLNAECCDIYTDVDGVYSADPRIVQDATKLDKIAYKEMHEMALCGAQVLNARSVETAMLNNVPIRVRSTFCPEDEGTLVTSNSRMGQEFLCGITCDAVMDTVCISLQSPTDLRTSTLRKFRKQRYEAKVKLFKLLKEVHIPFERAVCLKNSTERISFLVKKADIERTQFLLKEAGFSRDNSEVNKGMVRVSIVSNRIVPSIEIDAIMALSKAGIPISMVSRHSNRISFLVPESDREEAVKVLHEKSANRRVAA